MTNRIPPIRRGLAALLLAVPAMLCLGQEAATPAGPAPAAASAEAPPPVEAPKPAPATVSVLIHTERGDIQVAVEVERAPVTAKNFLRYVDNKRFDNITFYRVVKVTPDGKYGMVQGGQRESARLFPKIAHEAPAKTGISHVDGVISMGRNAPGTAAADFFFVIGDLTALDGQPDGSDPGYAAFGHVTSGMDVVKAILELPTSQEANNPSMKGQMLAKPVKILTVRRVP
jgi:peptidyl-prolyl cis-trans isomerase A (cyclophilin A)